MQRRSSGSSESSIDAPVRTNPGRVQAHGKLNKSDLAISQRVEAPTSPILDCQERQRNTSSKFTVARIRRPSSNINWKTGNSRDVEGTPKDMAESGKNSPSLLVAGTSEKDIVVANEDEHTAKMVDRKLSTRRSSSWSSPRNPWTLSIAALLTALAGLGLLAAILDSTLTRHMDPKGCRMSYMSPHYIHLREFDTEHTRFASKYSLYLYREAGINDNSMFTGVPVLFIPGNAGSYKQVRPIAAEAARYFHDVLQHDPTVVETGAKNLDFFTVDFNEDFTAFHGQTMLDQAEYLNEVIRYILSLYLDPHASRYRNPSIPDPSSVIVLGHSMGGIVARTMLTMPNYQSNSINTVLTMSTPHARPPVSFDPQIVSIYNKINAHWRNAYSQKWANDNPLWHVTLVSIAGGGLDTVVPSDYAAVESIVPETHGFTVFTSTIPNVWTSMDHAAILWCDQFRKIIARALYEIVDTSRASQTKPRADRMRVFKKRFLTGMEDIAENSLDHHSPQIQLTVDIETTRILTDDERLILPALGRPGQVKAHLIPVPPQDALGRKRFTLLSNSQLDRPDENGRLEVMLCSILPPHTSQISAVLSEHIDLSSDSATATKLACRNAASALIPLPNSAKPAKYPFFRDGERSIQPFSYLQFNLNDISDHQFVAVLDKATVPTPGWVVAEFSDSRDYHSTSHLSLRELLVSGLGLEIPADHPFVTELRIPSVRSSLLAYNLKLTSPSCTKQSKLFTPLLRQYINEPYESKFFVNAQEVQVSLHGIAPPYVPPPLKPKRSADGLAFQFWLDPTCNAPVTIRLTVDPIASLGKLYMRYRTVFAAFPLLIVALVIRKQFRVYDNTGIFIPFMESLDVCLRQSLPLLLLSLTLLAVSADGSSSEKSAGLWPWRNSTMAVDFSQNDLIVGTSDPFFWFLIPMIGLICVGVCTILHYVILFLTFVLGFGWGVTSARQSHVRLEDRKRATSPMFTPSSPRRRLITTSLLLLLVFTFIPYQFAFVVACLVQLSTGVRAHRLARDLPSLVSSNFSNYAHSILILMIWILPINLPTLIVWIRNLAVQWFTPFSSHHNILSILPFVLLVETLTSGTMVPRVTSRLRHLTSILLFGISIYAAVYGVSHAYLLHHLVNIVVAWLVLLHMTSNSWPFPDSRVLFGASCPGQRKQGKTP